MAKVNLNLLRAIKGTMCWSASYDVQTGLLLKFGKPMLKIGTVKERRLLPPNGKIKVQDRPVSLWGKFEIRDGDGPWDLFIENKLACTSRHSWQRISRGIIHLEGRKLKAIEIDKERGETMLRFDLDAEMRIKRMRKYELDDELWTIFSAKGNLLTFLADGTFESKRSHIIVY